MIRRIELMFALLFVFVGSAAAQRTVFIESNATDAVVFADSTLLGPVSNSPFQIRDDVVQIVVHPTANGLWNIDPLIFRPEPGDSVVRLTASFTYHYTVESVPSGAHVQVNGKLLGQTPILFKRDAALSADISVQKDGYVTASFVPGSGIWNREMLELQPVDGALTDGFELNLKKRKWINYTAAGTSLAAGILAIHLRTKADNRFDDFHETGNNRLKDDIRRLDIQSGISLGVMQLGLGVIAFRIAF